MEKFSNISYTLGAHNYIRYDTSSPRSSSSNQRERLSFCYSCMSMSAILSIHQRRDEGQSTDVSIAQPLHRMPKKRILTFPALLAIMSGTLSGCSAVVAHLLPKQSVVGSNPITRSNDVWQPLSPVSLQARGLFAMWPGAGAGPKSVGGTSRRLLHANIRLASNPAGG